MPKERGGDEELVKTIPLRRVGEHIELANLAAFLVSDGRPTSTALQHSLRADGPGERPSRPS
jgi:hypothetical protein